MAGAVTPRRPDPLERIWIALRQPALLLALVALLILLLAATRLVPQAPGQTQDDPAAAQRWVNAESDNWARAGPVMRTLGLFAVVGSPAYYLLLALLFVVFSVQMTDAVQRVLLPARLKQRLTTPAGDEPVTIPSPDRIERLRTALPLPAGEAVEALQRAFAPNTVQVRSHPVPGDDVNAPPEEETRLLASRNLRIWWLRALAPLGALVLIVALWAGALWGWNVVTPVLAPGDAFSWPAREMTVAYTDTVGSAAASPDRLQVAAGGTVITLPVDVGETRAGGARVAVREAAPALWVAADESLLQRPGEAGTQQNLGLVFAQPGSEQVVVLPGIGAGLRVVRLSAAPERFMVELFAEGAEQPVQRFEISTSTSITLPVAGQVIELDLEPAPAVTVEVRSAPMRWLYAPALLLLLAGLAGYLVRPRFAFAQVRPWPRQRVVVTLQSNDAALVGLLEGLSADSEGGGGTAYTLPG